MTDAERRLLLTVARLMRAKIGEEIYASQEEDFEVISEALKPFDPLPSDTILTA